MVSSECRQCKKFLTNDCSGTAEFNEGACKEVMKKMKKEVDVSGCC